MYIFSLRLYCLPYSKMTLMKPILRRTGRGCDFHLPSLSNFVCRLLLTIAHGTYDVTAPLHMDVKVGRYINTVQYVLKRVCVPRCESGSRLLYYIPRAPTACFACVAKPELHFLCMYACNSNSKQELSLHTFFDIHGFEDIHYAST